MSTGPIVMKFGGTSVEDAAAFARVSQIVRQRQSGRPVIVVSAMSGMTDALIACVEAAAHQRNAQPLLEEHLARHGAVANELLPLRSLESFRALLEKSRNELCGLLNSIAERAVAPNAIPADLRDQVLAFGEDLSSNLLAATLGEKNLTVQQVDARKCIVTDGAHGAAIPHWNETVAATNSQLAPLLENGITPVLGGFVASDARGRTTTLGRGGSDYSAALIGAALRASEIQIWTDVDGVLTADPRIESRAFPVPLMSYAEAAELAYFGAKVLHPKTIQPAVEFNIPVRICNSRTPGEPGTLVCAESESAASGVKAIAHKAGVTTIQITSARMLGAYGFLRRLFELFDKHRTVVDVVTTSEVSVSLSLDTAPPAALLHELEELGVVRVEEGRAIVCVVGAGLRGTPGIAARVFNTISDINVSLISQGASSVNLTFAVDEQFVTQAVTRLHETFFQKSNVQSPTN